MEQGIEIPPPLPADAPETAAPPAQTQELHWARLAWAGEFLLAITAATIVWTEVGGQVHLDMMPWYLKLLPLLAFALCCVRFTIAARQPQVECRGAGEAAQFGKKQSQNGHMLGCG